MRLQRPCLWVDVQAGIAENSMGVTRSSQYSSSGWRSRLREGINLLLLCLCLEGQSYERETG